MGFRSTWSQRLEEWKALHWSFIFAMGVLSTLVGFTLAIFLIVAYTNNRHPLDVVVLDPGIDGPVCPGDEITTTIKMEADANLFIDLVWGFNEADNPQFVVGTIDEVLMMLPGEEKRLVVRREVPWVVPEKPPGDHTAVRGYYMRGEGIPAEYVEIHFTVPEGC